MITSIDQLDINAQYSYADYLTWRFTERIELIKGHIFKMSPAPLMKHQSVSSNLTGILWNYLNGKPCQLFHAPFDVRLLDSKKVKNKADDQVYTVVQPDICIVCDKEKLDLKGCVGAPDLIIEITSKSTKKRDVTDKFRLYEENGVLEYWIVLPDSELIEVFDLKDGKFEFRKNYVDDDLIPVGIFPEFSVEVNRIFS